MERGTSAGQAVRGSVQAVDTRTGRTVSLFLEEGRLRVETPDRTSQHGVSVTTFGLDQIVLAGPVPGRVAGRRGAWVITRAVGLEDEQWGVYAPAWSWVLAPDDGRASRRSNEWFLAQLRTALPKKRWVKAIRLGRAARELAAEAAIELLELASRRDPAFAATCFEVGEAKRRRAAGLADEAERILKGALQWRDADGVTTVTP